MKVVFLDFDATLMDAPLPEEGKFRYEIHHKIPYPHVGWWSKPESLCLAAFDIQPFYKMDQLVKEAIADPDVRTVLLTNRIGRLEPHVRAVLDKHGYVLDMYTFKTNNDNKGERIRKILDLVFSTATEAVFYDDDVQHLRDAREAMRTHPIPLQLFRVERGEVIRFR